MLNYLSRRFVYAVLVLLGVNLATFILFFTVNTPDDMARLNLGGKRVTADAIAKRKSERGYDKPLYFNPQAQGSAKFTETIFWERSVSLFALKFGRAATLSPVRSLSPTEASCQLKGAELAPAPAELKPPEGEAALQD